MGILLDQLGYIAISVLAVRLLYNGRWTLSSLLLTGLSAYDIPDEPDEKAPERRSGGGSEQMPRRRRRRLEQERRHKLDLGNAEEIVVMKLSRTTVEESEFFSVFDYLVMLAALTAINFASGLVGEALFGVRNSITVPLAIITILGGVWALAQVELLSDLTPRHERMYMFGLVACLFAACYAFLLLAPLWMVDFKLQASIKELGVAVTKAVAARLQQPKGEVPTVMFDPLVVFLPLSAVCCVLGGLMFTPAVRGMRSHYLWQSPPRDLRHFMEPGVLTVAILQLRFLAALLCIISWIDPVIELLNGPPWLLEVSKPTLVLLWAVLQLASFRPLVQGYLHGALVQWHSLRMRGGDKKDEQSIKTIITLKVQVNTFLLCRVGVQMLAPAVITACCGLVMIVMRVWMAGGVTVSDDGESAFPSMALYHFGGFCAWWTCLLWFIYSGLTLSMYRFGLLVN
ncbi:unnamed protein product [Ostreobium quekettii]|uniref:Transmembrane protein n=1 Tax=Ostreobium quekettii TaxID=121088 RepID=A0A8S1IY88_9CHLO|nr:unnamed protein product [Ostreobium quekettii]